MFSTVLAILLSWMSPSDLSPTPAESFEIDGGHSSVLFRVTHFGVAPFYGRFNDVSGSEPPQLRSAVFDFAGRFPRRASSARRFFDAAHEQIGHWLRSCRAAGQCSRPK